MLISREADYALRILRALSAGGQLTVGDITQDQAMPKQFAYKIIKKLEKAGFVSVTRGTAGGCRLAADLTRVNLYDLLSALDEDSHLLSACLVEGYTCAFCEGHGGCGVHTRLGQVQKEIDDQLRSYTLAALLGIEPAGQEAVSDR